MDFEFNEEQRALEDTVQRFVARDYDFETRKAIAASPAGWNREIWSALAELGVLALNVPEEHGGLGHGPIETSLVMNAFGAGLLLEPYLPAAVVAPALIRRLATPDFQAGWLPRIAAGEAIVIPVDGERLTLAEGTHGPTLSGRLRAVPHGAAADLWLVARDGALYTATPTVKDYPLLDGRRAADLAFDRTPATKVSHGGTADDATFGFDTGLAALCAEAVGILDATVAATTDYLKTRQQFGQPIGRFQALQHRMADMLLHVEQARSMSWLAAMRCTSENPAGRRRALSAAKVVIGNACRFVGQNAVQLHGGMGMTDELILSHWFKRLTTIEMSDGDTDHHLQRFARLCGRAA